MRGRATGSRRSNGSMQSANVRSNLNNWALGNQTLLMVAIMVLVMFVGTALDLGPTILILTPILMLVPWLLLRRSGLRSGEGSPPAHLRREYTGQPPGAAFTA